MKPPSGRSRGPSTNTGSLALLIRLIDDDEIDLFGDLWLFDEYKRLSERLHSETSDLILGQLAAKMKEVLGVREDAVERCEPYLPEGEAADVMHAAVCLQTGAILITNDKDFDGIRDAGIIEVWDIGEAMRRLSILR